MLEKPKINIKNFNVFTLISVLFLLAGIIFYIYWIGRYPDAAGDVGIYSITIVLVLAGVFGTILTLIDKTEE